MSVEFQFVSHGCKFEKLVRTFDVKIMNFCELYLCAGV